MSSSITVTAFAKLNLTLDVLGRRPDGYHELASVMQSLELHDVITIQVTDGETEVWCDDPDVPSGRENLVFQALDVLRQSAAFHSGLRVEIAKRIPVAAGLAGGSTDAAQVLLGVNYLLGLGFTVRQLVEMGSRIGSDIPFCLLGGTALACGRGEVLHLLPPPPAFNVVLAKPQLQLSTPRIYRLWDELGCHRPPASASMTAALNSGIRERVLEAMENHLESVVMSEYQEVKELKARLLRLGAEQAILCGSGPTVAAVVPNPETGAGMVEDLTQAGYHAWLTHTLV